MPIGRRAAQTVPSHESNSGSLSADRKRTPRLCSPEKQSDCNRQALMELPPEPGFGCNVETPGHKQANPAAPGKRSLRGCERSAEKPVARLENTAAGEKVRSDAPRTIVDRPEHIEDQVTGQHQITIVTRSDHVHELRAHTDARGKVEARSPAEHGVMNRGIVHKPGPPG